MNRQVDTKFEDWAKMLISRKVPGRFRRSIDAEAVHCGARILRRGGAFEVRVLERCFMEGTNAPPQMIVPQLRILITPIMPRGALPAGS